MPRIAPGQVLLGPSSFLAFQVDPTPAPPLHPLANHTAGTASSSSEASGWRASIHLDTEGRTPSGPSSRWRSGEELKGFIKLEPTVEAQIAEAAAGPRNAPTSVVVRCYWQSSTSYITHKIVPMEMSTGLLSKLKPAAASLRTVAQERGEWHRGYCDGGAGGTELWNGGELEDISREVEGDFPLLLGELARERPPVPVHTVDPSATTTLPFAFQLPTITHVNEASASSRGPPNRRQLQYFQRTPPPSLPGVEGRNGAVEWVVEVLVRLADPSLPESSPPDTEEQLPSFNAATHDPAYNISTFGLRTTSPLLIVHRVVFPFEPSDYHAQDLYSSWRPTVTAWSEVVARHNGTTLEEIHDDREVTEGTVPLFGRDPRDEALGGCHMGVKRKMQNKLVEENGGRAMWMSFEKRMAIKGRAAFKMAGWIRCEAAIPFPFTISRHATSLPILLNFSYNLPDKARAAQATSSSSLPSRHLCVHSVTFLLSRRTLTRGGPEQQAKFLFEDVRRCEIKMWDSMRSDSTTTPLQTSPSRAGEVEDGRQHLRLELGHEEGVDVRVEFPLQTDGFMSSDKKMTKLKDLRLGVRTPNIEVEYILAVTIKPVGNHPSFYAARVPMQILAGDMMAPPGWSAPSQAISLEDGGLPVYGV